MTHFSCNLNAIGQYDKLLHINTIDCVKNRLLAVTKKNNSSEVDATTSEESQKNDNILRELLRCSRGECPHWGGRAPASIQTE